MKRNRQVDCECLPDADGVSTDYHEDTRHLQGEEEAELKKKARDEAFLAWVREKDKILRAQRRQVSCKSEL